MRQLPLGVRLPDRAVFASFLPARNGEAVEHARRIATGQAAGVVWLCGPDGAGKTHLLQAICTEANDATVTFDVTVRGGAEALDRALAGSGRLARSGAGNARLVYQYRP